MQSVGTGHPTFFQEFGSVFRIIRLSLRDVWEDLWGMLVVNLLWTLCVLTIIPGPPATLAVYRFANRLVHGEEVDLHDFLEGFRQSWATAWQWGAINLIVLLIFAGDIYLSNQDYLAVAVPPLVQSFYIALLVVWLLWQSYVLVFMLEQEQMVVGSAFRNAAVMLGKNFSFTVAYILEVIITLLVGTLLFMISFAIGGVLLAVIGNRAVLFNLERDKTR